MNDYKKAVRVLESAAKALSNGAATHGDTERSFSMIGTMWATYVSHAMAMRKELTLTGSDVATMMMMVKQARSLYGNSIDNSIDAAGYAALAAMLNPAVVDTVNSAPDKRIDSNGRKHEDQSVQ